MKNSYKNILIIFVMLLVCTLTLGYAAFGSEMSISNIVAEVRIKKDVRITGVSAGEGIFNTDNFTLNYDVDSVLSNVTFDSLDQYIVYSVDVINIESAEVGIYDITGIPDGLSYELSNYSLKDKICNTSGQCNLGATKTIDIKVYPNSTEGLNTYNLKIEFDFRVIHNISYENITVNNYPDYIIDGGNLKISFTDVIPELIAIYSNSTLIDDANYSYVNGVLTFNSVTSDLIIKNPYKIYDVMALSTNGIDSSVSFSKVSTTSNGYGINTVSGTEDDTYPIYYYRGAVSNNNVLFANFCWKMVRTTDTGGVKLIYNGVPASDGSCNNTGTASQLSSSSAFNTSYNSFAYLGYMYGTVHKTTSRDLSGQSSTYLYGNDVSYDSSTGMYTLVDTTSSSSWLDDIATLATKYHYTCFNTTGECSSVYYIYSFNNSNTVGYYTLSGGMNLDTLKSSGFANTNDSVMKTTLETWYKDNLLSYGSYIEDTVWCNDRTPVQGPFVGKDADSTSYTHTFFGGYYRTRRSLIPSLKCENINDCFSVSSTIGNGKLTYPIGLLTADEVAYAGAASNLANKSYYLYSGQNYWVMSPAVLTHAYGTSVNTSGYLTSNYQTDESLGVRPAISLKYGLYAYSGSGTAASPYVIRGV